MDKNKIISTANTNKNNFSAINYPEEMITDNVLKIQKNPANLKII